MVVRRQRVNRIGGSHAVSIPAQFYKGRDVVVAAEGGLMLVDLEGRRSLGELEKLLKRILEEASVQLEGKQGVEKKLGIGTEEEGEPITLEELEREDED